MLSLVVDGRVRRHSATRVAMLVLSAAGLAGVLGLVRRGRSISDEVSGGAMASGIQQSIVVVMSARVALHRLG